MTGMQEKTMIDIGQFSVDPVRGFLPSNDPPNQLPGIFAELDGLCSEIPVLIMNGRLREAVENLCVPELAHLETDAFKERAMMLLAALASAWVWSEDSPDVVIPANLAVPFCKLANLIGRPPIVAHASLVLHNWRRIDTARPVELGNIVSQQLFLGGVDEQWFYLATLGVETAGAAALPALAKAQFAAEHRDANELESALSSISDVLPKMLEAFERMFEKCDPYVFYHYLRPFLEGWKEPGVIYEGVSKEPRCLVGGSAAQSSLLQSIDAGLGIDHQDSKTRPFLMSMREYMPPPHRRFIEALEQGPSVRIFVLERSDTHPTLVEHYHACIDGVKRFRESHIATVRKYIVAQARDGESASGTGGTEFMKFLGRTLKETRNSRS